MGISLEELRILLSTYPNGASGVIEGWIFGKLKLDGLPEYYQSTYHSKNYIHEEYSKLFKIVLYLERGMASYQDAIVLLNEKP